MASTDAAVPLSENPARRRLLVLCAWAVHLYTAIGAALGLLAIHYAATGDFRSSFLAMGLATVIDSSDGPLARLVKVRSRVPSFDGALLDNIVDYLTYTAAPVFLMLEAGIIATDYAGLLLASFVMLASAYWFCQSNAKTADHYFLGFPVYWNLVALYLFCLGLSTALNYMILGALVVMIFVPIKYIYPSRTVPFRPLTLTLGVVWAGVTIALLLTLPRPNAILLYASLSFVGYYFLASFALGARALARRTASSGEGRA